MRRQLLKIFANILIESSDDMNNKIGVMQGRLVPKYQGRYQAFPIGMWKDEFNVAEQCGLDLIEFILDYNDAEKNPLLKNGGIDEIVKTTKATGVSVQTICAEFIVKANLCRHLVGQSGGSQAYLYHGVRLLRASTDYASRPVVFQAASHDPDAIGQQR